jgi:hypothetical protein
MATTTEQWGNIPSWEIAQLTDLSNSGALSGVDPYILSGIAQAESGGQGGGVNSEGYGGYFGLGTAAYPGGYQLSESELTGTTPEDFDIQAETAAAEFASLLSKNGEDPYLAEQAYQGGSSEGDEVFQSLNIPGLDAGGNVLPAEQAAQLDLSLNPASDAGSAAGSAVASGVESLFGISGGAGLATRILLVIVALILLAVGLDKLFDQKASPTDVVIQGSQAVPQHAKRAAQWSRSGGGRSSFGPSKSGTASGSKSKSPGTPFKTAKAGAEDVGEAGAAVA